ncbi:MAG: kinase/pyrophosphorylase [Alphaproteobacteria bacterium]|nr:kinase/pyrophosphorylase [Alphaproteobacteria bacterium]
MRSTPRPAIYFHLHLVSDATGETLNAVARAATAQFEMVRPLEHIYALVRTHRQMDRALKAIEAAPGVVMYTLMSSELRTMLEERCRMLNMPAIPVLDPVLNVLANYLGLELSHKPGGQHAMDAEYFRRIEALNFTMAHDDGQNTGDLEKADVILLGVSRTSKTPTCIYLANRGVKAANIPIVMGCPLPPELNELTQPLVVGLTATPERVVQIRRNRLLSLKQSVDASYAAEDTVREEIVFARRLYRHHNWPVIDVSRRSIEETAAAVLNLYNEHRQRLASGGEARPAGPVSE